MNIYGSGRTVADVAVDITVQCWDERGRSHEIDTVLGYRRQDPFAVTMTFLTGDGDLTWTFGRELLARGVSVPTGEGDVRISPTVAADGRATITVELSSPDGHLALTARSEDVHDFLNRAHAIVPAGQESDHLDVDRLIAQVLAA
jgi:hypothetical protein